MRSEIDERRNEMNTKFDKIIRNTKNGLASEFLNEFRTDSKASEN